MSNENEQLMLTSCEYLNLDKNPNDKAQMSKLLVIWILNFIYSLMSIV